MAIEIEAKMRVPDLGPIRARLEQLGAKRRSRVIETNIIFDRSDQSFSAAAQGLRVRQVRDAESGKELPSTMTYKGPPLASELKSREEIEFTVNKGSAAAELLQRLGMHPVLTFEKQRESWDHQGCHVELDQVPHLGSFVEVEGPGEPQVMQVREMLQLQDHPIIKSSYAGMLLAFLEKAGHAHRVIKF